MRMIHIMVYNYTWIHHDSTGMRDYVHVLDLVTGHLKVT
jgi:UDP-glucose 4-epimerase